MQCSLYTYKWVGNLIGFYPITDTGHSLALNDYVPLLLPGEDGPRIRGLVLLSGAGTNLEIAGTHSSGRERQLRGHNAPFDTQKKQGTTGRRVQAGTDAH